ncbi:universal stress protein [Radiobacillus sp. PE A8.2]|uniref:universal stress protein n=1 Tax=Radiobacillus sp. PE A8.2 TaxID=3380349 RepID=UPI00388FDEE9
MFKKIMLASDGSAHAIRAAEKVVELASHNVHVKVDIVYVIDGNKSKSDVLHHWNSFDVERSRKEKLTLTEQKLKHANIKYDIKILHGEPGPTIIKYANDAQIDLCVIGSRGLNRLQEMVLGSVSHKVAKHVKCPVLIVK